MPVAKAFLLACLTLTMHTVFTNSQKQNATSHSKIVAWVQVRNEEKVIEQCLRMLALYADAIVILDDASNDNTLRIVNNLAQELPIAEIIINTESAWQKKTESSNRQKLLEAARRAGGTHFIMIDADELFTTPCARKNWLRKKILSLQPGQFLRMPTIHPWESLQWYRHDQECSPFMHEWHKIYAFADDGICSYQDNRSASGSVAIHAGRSPKNLVQVRKEQTICIEDLKYGVIHFQCINLKNTELRKSWYMCLELMRDDEIKGQEHHAQHIHEINAKYANHHYKGMLANAPTMHREPLPAHWYNYDFFDGNCYAAPNQQKIDEIQRWFTSSGADYFSGLELCPEVYAATQLIHKE